MEIDKVLEQIHAGVQFGVTMEADVIKPKGKFVPVFDAGAGEPSSFDDMGYPIGVSNQYEWVDYKGIDKNSFGVIIHGDSMSPIINEGDLAIIKPSETLENGSFCFAYSADGNRRVKRYYRYGETIVFRSENPKHKDIEINAKNTDSVRLYRVTRIIKKV
ncbi:MAG: hypothetical protein CO012_02935 [Syntrophobacterales bacterium CG_4_8_14_3_um_filter_49_14]|nr:MAG: hypothetical protein COS92_05485 [Desulfobacterales bacterium CG07_land_8_20_14_0_80_52_14]PJC75592.1 MAG: hypothetical protein CO012_02935 [Syntrophobacterales bacterium CG_4_8_14_3_um_filter_49_14]